MTTALRRSPGASVRGVLEPAPRDHPPFYSHDLAETFGGTPVTFSIRWIFAVLAIIGGVYIAIKSNGNAVVLVTGLSIISAAIATVTP